MQIAYGIDAKGNLEAAVANIKNPSALIIMTTEQRLEQHVAEMNKYFPGVPCIGGVGMSYAGVTAIEKGVTVAAIYGANVAANVLENVSTMPVNNIARLEEAIKAVGAQKDNSACFDFCTGHDGKLVTTMNVVLNKQGIPLIGGTVDCNKVVVNGVIYDDACGFLVIKNLSGSIKAYKENLYLPRGERFIATKTMPEKNVLCEVDGKPAEQFYRETLGIDKEAVATQTFKNPLGRVFGSETYLISIKDIQGKALECYKQVNDMDVLTLMEIGDYDKIVSDTIDKIKSDLPGVKGILSVNCLFRYLLFQQENYLGTYLKKMNQVTTHVGLVGLGEHYNKQHINQTMCCIAFD